MRLHHIIETYINYLSLFSTRLRAKVLVIRGASVKEKVSLGKRLRIDKPWCVEIGERTSAERDVYIKIVDDKARLKIGDYVFIAQVLNSMSWKRLQ
jgi:serine acetyltransferase